MFTIVPAVELAVLIKVGGHIGVMNTFTIIILTGVAGAYLARLQGFYILRNIQSSMAQGIMPTEEMLDGLMVFCGGIVLLTPGFITDLFGFILLIPFTRMLIKSALRHKFNKMLTSGQISTYQHTAGTEPKEDIEDADFH